MNIVIHKCIHTVSVKDYITGNGYMYMYIATIDA